MSGSLQVHEGCSVQQLWPVSRMIEADLMLWHALFSLLLIVLWLSCHHLVASFAAVVELKIKCFCLEILPALFSGAA